jgi:hypothetical protein
MGKPRTIVVCEDERAHAEVVLCSRITFSTKARYAVMEQ